MSDNQFGFRTKRSTCDALKKVKRVTKEAVAEGGVAIAVGLDIANAFNSLPWSVIREALRRKGFSSYIRRIVDNYLAERTITFTTNDGARKQRTVEVPQGSVLGPLLWNIGFDSVLRMDMEEGCEVVCYADDIMILVTAGYVRDAVVRAEVQIARVMRHIRELGLTIAEQKTEAVLFYKRRQSEEMPEVIVGDTRIQVRTSMKYLGLINSKWRFREHYLYVEEKIARVTRALSRLMPNLRGPDERKRQLYAKLMSSIVMYGAPL